MNLYAIILAAGISERFSGALPKQFSLLNRMPLVWHSLQKFHSFNSEMTILLSLSREGKMEWKRICKEFKITIPHITCEGGSTRAESVRNALENINDDGYVFIHDAARPCFEKRILERLLDKTKHFGNAIPTIMSDSAIRKMENNESFSVNRNDYRLVQTPQCFNLEKIKRAYKENFSAGAYDDAQILEGFGESIQMIEGEKENIKITYQQDLDLVKLILEAQVRNG